MGKIDADGDGFVTVEELKAWIKFAQKRWIYEDVERQWKGHDLNEDGLVSWEEYKNATYGYILGRSCLLGRAEMSCSALGRRGPAGWQIGGVMAQ